MSLYLKWLFLSQSKASVENGSFQDGRFRLSSGSLPLNNDHGRKVSVTPNSWKQTCLFSKKERYFRNRTLNCWGYRGQIDFNCPKQLRILKKKIRLTIEYNHALTQVFSVHALFFCCNPINHPSPKRQSFSMPKTHSEEFQGHGIFQIHLSAMIPDTFANRDRNLPPQTNHPPIPLIFSVARDLTNSPKAKVLMLTQIDGQRSEDEIHLPKSRHRWSMWWFFSLKKWSSMIQLGIQTFLWASVKIFQTRTLGST